MGKTRLTSELLGSARIQVISFGSEVSVLDMSHGVSLLGTAPMVPKGKPMANARISIEAANSLADALGNDGGDMLRQRLAILCEINDIGSAYDLSSNDGEEVTA